MTAAELRVVKTTLTASVSRRQAYNSPTDSNDDGQNEMLFEPNQILPNYV